MGDKRNIVIFDIDGVLCNAEHRVHFVHEKDWTSFYEACDKDEPIEANVTMLNLMLANPDVVVMFFTGRTESVRSKTNIWLTNHASVSGHTLLMRKDGDYRPDYVVKKEMADSVGTDNILCVFEDRDQVVKMWRDNGVQCYQTCEGTY